MEVTVPTFPKIPNTELYLAGGYVRDFVMGKQPKDEDYVAVTEFSFPEFIDVFNTVGKVHTFSEKHLTLRGKIEDRFIDIAFPRTESGTTDHRHPEKVERADSLEEDASRRDFTMNAMFMNSGGVIIDYFNGTSDIEKGFIRCVGDPKERFKEDALRILRAIRFSCRLDFQIAYDTRTAMYGGIKLLKHISQERIMDELNKAFAANMEMTLYWLHHYEEDLLPILKEKGLNFQLTNKRL